MVTKQTKQYFSIMSVVFNFVMFINGFIDIMIKIVLKCEQNSETNGTTSGGLWDQG